MKKSILSMLALFTFFCVHAQDSYTIKMSLKIDGLPPEYAAYGEQEITSYMKGSKAKRETSGMMNTSVQYFDGKKYTFLIDAMGNKYGFTATPQEMAEADKDKKEKPVIEYIDEKKMIAGYECSKAIVKSKGKDKKESISVIWYTDAIKMDPELKKGSKDQMLDLSELKGIPLAMELTSENQGQEMKIMITATEVLTESLDDKVFVPDTNGYTMMTYQEAMEKQKGGRR